MKAKSLVVVFHVLLFFTGCTNDGKTNDLARPIYAAHIVNMDISSSMGTTASSPSAQSFQQSALSSAATPSVQEFYSGNVLWNIAHTVNVTTQNDSNVPIKLMLITLGWCGGATGDVVQPGEIVNTQLNLGGNGTLLALGASDYSVWVYPQPADWDLNCQPDIWDGTLPSLMNYVATHPPLTMATDHFNVVLPSYTDNGDDTISESVSGLVWQKQDDGITRTLDDAITYCSSLTLPGSGWRVPSVIELLSIWDPRNNPMINNSYFPSTQLSHYWSSTRLENGNTFVIYFFPWNAAGNGADFNSADSLNYIRCVR